MPISIACPSCGRSHAVPDDFAGTAAICSSCHAHFQIPGPDGDLVTHQPDRATQTVVFCPTCGNAWAVANAEAEHSLTCKECSTQFRVEPPTPSGEGPANRIEMPASTSWPMVLSVGLALLAAGVVTSLVLSLLGAGIFVVGLAGWIGQLLPGRGRALEPVGPESKPQGIIGRPGTVDYLDPTKPGYRFRLPVDVHPISAGIKGGIVGGFVMPIPTFIYGIVSGHGIWYPINLLAGMVIPAIGSMPEAELERFQFLPLIVGIVIHAILSVGFGIIYGVVLPTLPRVWGGPILWGGILMPLFWTWLSYGMMGIINPVLEQHVDWTWFLLSQFVYGLAMSTVVFYSEKVYVPPAGTHPAPAPNSVPEAAGGVP